MKILYRYLEQLQNEKTLSNFLSNFKRVIKFTSEKDHSIGLLRYNKIPKDIAFLFEFNDNIIRTFHTIGMKFNIDILFFDKNKNLIIEYNDVTPGIKNISSKKECKYVVEILSF